MCSSVRCGFWHTFLLLLLQFTHIFTHLESASVCVCVWMRTMLLLVYHVIFWCASTHHIIYRIIYGILTEKRSNRIQLSSFMPFSSSFLSYYTHSLMFFFHSLKFHNKMISSLYVFFSLLGSAQLPEWKSFNTWSQFIWLLPRYFWYRMFWRGKIINMHASIHRFRTTTTIYPFGLTRLKWNDLAVRKAIRAKKMENVIVYIWK